MGVDEKYLEFLEKKKDKEDFDITEEDTVEDALNKFNKATEGERGLPSLFPSIPFLLFIIFFGALFIFIMVPASDDIVDSLYNPSLDNNSGVTSASFISTVAGPIAPIFIIALVFFKILLR